MSKPEIESARIVNSAIQTFTKYGFDKTTMNDIASDIGCSKRTLYNYFPDKNALFLEAVTQHLSAIASHLSACLESTGSNKADQFVLYMLERMDCVSRSGLYHYLVQRIAEKGRMIDEDLMARYTDFQSMEKRNIYTILKYYFPDHSTQTQMDQVVDIMQMQVTGLDILFFVQGKYEDYKETFKNMIKEFRKLLPPVYNV